MKSPAVYLAFGCLYLLVLLSRLVMDTGRFPHPRSYLMDFRLASPARLAGDALLNLVVFVPLGWLLGRGLRSLTASRATRRLSVTAFCAVLSLTVETVQYFLPTRYSSAIDVLTNTLGSFLGVTLAERWGRP
jgi:glycopeptide antibiotics resistance protein